MKRSISVLLVLGLIFAAFAAVPAQAAKKKKAKRIERVVEIPYTLGGIGVLAAGAGGGICPMTEPGSAECIEVPILSEKETFIKVEVNDVLPVGPTGFISQGDTDGDGISDGYGTFCRAHEEAIPLEGGTTPVRISFYPGVCEDGTPSFPTTGTIKVTLSNMP